MDDHLYLVTYDISDPKRWRAIYELMNQLIHHQEDAVLIIDIGVDAPRFCSELAAASLKPEPAKSRPQLIR